MSDEEIKKPEENIPARNASLSDAGGEPKEDISEVVDDIVFNEDGEEDFKKNLKKLREDLKVAKKEKEEYLTGWQKERADFANYKKGEDDRKAMFSESIRERILTRFLTVVD